MTSLPTPPLQGTIMVYRPGIAAPLELTFSSCSNVVINKEEGGYNFDFEPSGV